MHTDWDSISLSLFVSFVWIHFLFFFWLRLFCWICTRLYMNEIQILKLFVQVLYVFDCLFLHFFTLTGLHTLLVNSFFLHLNSLEVVVRTLTWLCLQILKSVSRSGRVLWVESPVTIKIIIFVFSNLMTHSSLPAHLRPPPEHMKNL